MEVKIKAIHFDATEKLEQFITKKVEKLVKHHEEISLVEVTLKVVKPETAMNKEAGIKVEVPQHGDLFASKVADTFEEAVDLAVDAQKKQLEKLSKVK
ncbi:MAG: HPF/RaiA family ribosome-associated protein [Bacteroidales bacterium]|nr:HPF/RaiA family ribosome-associated protein [Muribaculaceae bacterium]MDO4970831.1 HPF/RaiA family ribosome-associated protein [Bacteroidales bacterium]